MFHSYKAKKTQRAYQRRMARWTAQRDEYAELLQLARSFTGQQSSSLILKSGERVFAEVTNTSLIEERRGPGHYEGRSRGISIPLGFGVRYRTGGSRGHYVQGQATSRAVDVGTTYVTNHRVVFQGARQTRECLFSKLVGSQHTRDGATILSVSNRQKATVIHYGTKIAGWFDFHLDLALAHYRQTVPQLIDQMTNELREIEAREPAIPVEVRNTTS